MKIPSCKNCLLWITLALLFIFSGMIVYATDHGVVETIKKASAPFNDLKEVSSISLFGDNLIPVQVKHLGELFWTESRKDRIERFKCSQCHNNKKVSIARAAETTHGDIVLVHGGNKQPLQCFTCHDKDARDFLVTEKGVNVDLDHSYQLCGQCHFRQQKDWVGGAHGKRVSYWAGKRVVKNCTFCHNPHSPRFKKRWPKTYSRPLMKTEK